MDQGPKNDAPENMESLELKLRSYDPADKEEVFKLHVEALGAVGSYDPSARNEVDRDLEDIESVYLKPGGEFLVGTVGNKIVTMGGLKILSSESGEIKRMRTHPDFWRQGFAQKILDKLEDKARDAGLKSLELDTWIIQEAAKNLYEKNGYVEYKREMGPISKVERIFYRKML